MTLDTRIYVLDEIDPGELFRFCQGLLARYDDHERPATAQEWEDRQSLTWREGQSFVEPGNHWVIANEPNQSLPAWLMIDYRPGAPLRPDVPHECTDYCEPERDEDDPEGYHDIETPCWADVSFDTAYGYRTRFGQNCGELHAALIVDLGRWLDSRGIAWSWRNEYTGEIWGGDDRYPRLEGLLSGSDNAVAWFTNLVKPAIEAHAAASGATVEW